MTTDTSPKRSELTGVLTHWQIPLERAEVSGDGNTLAGYAAVTNVWSEFDSWEGPFRARLDPKAFDKTLAQRGTDFKVLVDHGHDTSFGGLPIGKPTKVEMRPKGLWTETQLSKARSVQEEIKPRLEEGSLDGMSITFEVLSEEWGEGEDGMDERTIKEVRLHEFGPVVFPQFPEAAIAGVFSKGTKEGAGSPEDEGRSTEEAAAPEDEGRITSADDERKKRFEELERESARMAGEVEWLRRAN
jgi:HK97 family phage prohead protease